MDIRDLVLHGLTATHTRITRCLADLTNDEARSLPNGLTPIIWQAGHVALVDFNYARRADGQSEAPAGYADLFRPGTGGEAAYPPLADIRDTLDRAHRALEGIARTGDLSAPQDSPNFRTVGEMLVYDAYHRGYHIGKMTTLRALLHKPRLFG